MRFEDTINGKTGSWTSQENRILTEFCEKNAIDSNPINYGDIAELVGRSAHVCKLHWERVLKWKVDNPNTSKLQWTDEHTIDLINTIVEVNPAPPMNWKMISEHFPHNVKYSHINKRWSNLVHKYVPDNKNVEHIDKLDIICKKIIFQEYKNVFLYI